MRSHKSPRMVPLIAAALLTLWLLVGSSGDQYLVDVAMTATLAAIVAVSLDVLFGFGGYVSMAQGAFYGVGAYATAWLMTERNWSFWAALPMSGLVTAAIALVIAGLVFRTRELYFAIITLGIALFASGLFVSMVDITGGTGGFTGIPLVDTVPFLGWSMDSELWLALALLILMLTVISAHLFRKSRWGRACVAVREDEILAVSLGMPVQSARLMAFLFSAFFAGLAGATLAASSGFIAPENFAIMTIGFQAIVICVVGGTGTIWGPILAAFILVALPETLHVASEYSRALYGIALLAMIIYAPRGLAGILKAGGAWVQTRMTRDSRTSETTAEAKDGVSAS